MNIRNGGTWKAFLLLSVVVPVGLIVTFIFTGLGGRPATIAETVTLEPAGWAFEKPSFTTDLPLWFENPAEARVQSTYVDRSVSITYVLNLWSYLSAYRFDNSPAFFFNATLALSVGEGFVDTARLVFLDSYEASQVILTEAQNYARFDNLTIGNWACGRVGRDQLLNSTLKAFIEAAMTNGTKQASLHLQAVDWLLEAPRNVSQELETAAEVIYFNGTDYVKVVLPLFLKLSGDVGDAFETARTIDGGDLTGSISVFDDPSDYYRIWLEKGQTITISGAVRLARLNLTLFGPDREPISNREFGGFSDEPVFMTDLTCMANTAGYWYIEAFCTWGQGIYRLGVDAE